MDRIDRYLGLQGQALPLQQERLTLLASNIANAATPGYKARDIDFKKVLAASDQQPALKVTNRRHFPTASPQAANRVGYRVPVEPSLDGNTVELATEQVQFSETALRYRSTLSVLSGRLNTLRSALKGE